MLDCFFGYVPINLCIKSLFNFDMFGPDELVAHPYSLGALQPWGSQANVITLIVTLCFGGRTSL